MEDKVYIFKNFNIDKKRDTEIKLVDIILQLGRDKKTITGH